MRKLLDFTELTEALICGHARKVEELVQVPLDMGVNPAAIVNVGLLPGMDEVGRRFKAGEFYLPEVLIAAQAMRAGLAVLRPVLATSGMEPVATIALGTVLGDLHDIGKNIVGIMFEGGGFEVIDLGIDVPPHKFVETVAEKGPDLLGLSALLTTTMPVMREVIDDLERAGLRRRIKVMVGGAPVTARFAEEIGADGYAPNAPLAVEKARELFGLN